MGYTAKTNWSEIRHALWYRCAVVFWERKLEYWMKLVKGCIWKLTTSTGMTLMDFWTLSGPSTYGICLDVVNLYGETMMKKLPTGGFESSDISLDQIMHTSEEGHVVYFFNGWPELSQQLPWLPQGFFSGCWKVNNRCWDAFSLSSRIGKQGQWYPEASQNGQSKIIYVNIQFKSFMVS